MNKFATLSGVFAICLWSFSATFISIIGSVDPYLWLTASMTVGFIVSVVRWVVKKQNPLPDIMSIPWWFYILVLMGIGLHNLMWIKAVQNAPAAEAVMIIYQWPILIVVFTSLVMKQSLRMSQVIALLLGFAGLAVLFSDRIDLSFANFQWQTGHTYAVICALSWSIYSALAVKFKHVSDNSISVNFLVVGVLCFVTWLLTAQTYDIPFVKLGIIAVYAVLGSSSYMFWDYGMKHGNAQLLGVLSFLIPAFSTLFLVIFGFVTLQITLIVSIALILLGIAVAKYAKF